MASLIYIAVFCVVLACTDGAPELLSNPDFESTDFHGNWWCKACHMASSNDAVHGKHSVTITNRDKNWKGLIQSVNITGGKTYRFHSYVKFLNIAHNAMYQSMGVVISCQLADGSTKYVPIGTTPKMKANEWHEVGDVRTLQDGSHNCQIYFQTEANANYMVDNCSMKEVTLESNWEAEADKRIEQYRKADMTISVQGNTGMNLDVEVSQQTHEFAFGSAVDARMMIDNVHTAYQNTFFDNFEWATLANAYKWRPMEWNQGQINYDTPLTATKMIKQHGKKVRGHCVFWGVDQYIQDWVKKLDGQALKNAIHTRIQGVISRTKGQLEQWDVNNENLHGDYYERHTNDPDITMDMFRQIHVIDNKTKLFLNDFNVLDYGQSATALKDQALKFKKAGVPIGGIGVQSHLHNPDDHFTAVKDRLDIVAEAGLPIMITELTVYSIRGEQQATRLELTAGSIRGEPQATRIGNLLKLFFSHPLVEGVVFWGFWDQKMKDHSTALFVGDNLTPNAAGKVYQDLTKNQWRTNKTVHARENHSVKVRGFKGTYNINVKHNGQVLKTKTVDLSTNGQQITINLNGQSGGHPTVSNIAVG